MESQSNVVSKSAEDKNEAKLLYNTGDTLRGFPWREVLGDSKANEWFSSLYKYFDNETYR